MNILRHLFIARLISYLGTQTIAWIFPVLVFHLTGSNDALGLFLILEWTPKLGAYFIGGFIVGHLGTRRSYLLVEASRAGAALAAAAAVLLAGHFSTILLICCFGGLASIFQMMNAVSNIVMEVSATNLLKPESRVRGFSILALADSLAGVIILPLGGWLVARGLSESFILAMVAAIFVSGLANTFFYSEVFRIADLPLGEENRVSRFSPGVVLGEAWAGLRFVLSVRSLRLLTANAFLNNMTVAFLAYNAPSILHRLFSGSGPGLMAASPGPPEAAYLSLVKTSICAAGFAVALSLTVASPGARLQRWLAFLGQSAIAIAILVATGGMGTPAVFLAGALVVNLGDLLWRIWQKGTRQKIIPAHLRLGVTGILIMSEAAGYVSAGLLMTAGLSPATGGILLAGLMATAILVSAASRDSGQEPAARTTAAS